MSNLYGVIILSDFVYIYSYIIYIYIYIINCDTVDGRNPAPARAYWTIRL